MDQKKQPKKETNTQRRDSRAGPFCRCWTGCFFSKLHRRVASPFRFAWHCVAADEQDELTLHRILSEDGKFPNVIQKEVFMEREVSCPMILAGLCHAKTDLDKIMEIAMAKTCKGLSLILLLRPLDTDLGSAVPWRLAGGSGWQAWIGARSAPSMKYLPCWLEPQACSPADCIIVLWKNWNANRPRLRPHWPGEAGVTANWVGFSLEGQRLDSAICRIVTSG